ncbi:aldolase [Gorillibacterium sp. sgz500922]|uniref:aldolase n=1 Tax=Gorillibacterium sp. sgz500922 TaxID=3446694 RepID=UPI003F67F872
MQLTKNEWRAEAFGFRLVSDLPFPELSVIPGAGEGGDIEIRLEPLAEEWERMKRSDRKIQAEGDTLLVHIPDTALFEVREGRTIRVSPVPAADMDKVRLYILGTCMGAILLQRSILPLHGSAVAIGGKAYAVVGESGMGKSTLARALMDRGLPLVSDDVIPVHTDGADPPRVTPSYPQQKLWQESLEALGRGNAGLKPLFERETKYAVPVGCEFAAHELPLGGIFELTKGPVAAPRLEPVRGLARMRLLYDHTYRNLFLRRMNRLDWHFQVTARLAETVPLYRLIRPEEGFTAHELADRIVAETRKEEKG